MKRYYLILFVIFLTQPCNSQNVDSLINLLEGKWDWYKTYGGFAGQTVTPADSGFSITVEFVVLQNDTVNFLLYKNDTLYRDTVATIFHLWENHWAISKNIIGVLRRYFPIYNLGQDYLGIVFTDSMDLVIYDAQVADSYHIYFSRRVSGLIEPLNNEHSITIYPNPFKNRLVIKFRLTQNEKCEISIYDCSLKTFHKEIIIIPSEYYVHEIENPDSFPPGIYFVKIVIGNNVYVRKIIGL